MGGKHVPLYDRWKQDSPPRILEEEPKVVAKSFDDIVKEYEKEVE